MPYKTHARLTPRPVRLADIKPSREMTQAAGRVVISGSAKPGRKPVTFDSAL